MLSQWEINEDEMRWEVDHYPLAFRIRALVVSKAVVDDYLVMDQWATRELRDWISGLGVTGRLIRRVETVSPDKIMISWLLCDARSLGRVV